MRDGEPLPALGATALEHLTAVLRRHPDQESVRLLPAPAIRLKCALALHNSLNPLRQIYSTGETIDSSELVHVVSIAAALPHGVQSLSLRLDEALP